MLKILIFFLKCLAGAVKFSKVEKETKSEGETQKTSRGEEAMNLSQRGKKMKFQINRQKDINKQTIE